MPGRRDPWLDNAKAILVILVVVGHAIVLLPYGDPKSRVYDFLYYFHIPAFVLVSGYLSRKFAWTPRHLTALVTTLVVPYVIFEWLMAAFRVYVVGQPSSMEVLQPLWLNPHWPMWYLVALVLWRLATPLLVRHWLMVPAAVAVSLAAGEVDLELFDLNRVLGLLPFFVIGLHLPRRGLELLQARWTGLVGLAVLAGIWWLTTRTDDHWSTQWLYYRSSYDTLGVSLREGAEIRAQLILVGLAGTAAVLTLVPRRRSLLTAVGAYTMGVYLLHGFAIRYAEAQGVSDWLPGNGWTSVAITVAAAVALALFLGWPPVARRLLWLVDPVNQVLSLRRRARRGPAAPENRSAPSSG
ncbi:acyltransferase family protein [Nocardioides sp. 616]|uniref:acyltransferase family protein n=1 Tax=Nocardioides sp. 616 TaxID=2268090 RepID=UPI000CE420AE|nr:acyltransferase family protein [Nocardioides sp. 616]